MSSSDPAFDALRTRLLAHLERGVPAGFACLRAHRRHSVSAVHIDAPLLALPLSGRKTVRASGAPAMHILPGELMVVCTPCTLDVENVPEADSGRYLTVAVTLCDAVLEASRLLRKDAALAPRAAQPAVARAPLGSLAPVLLRWCTAMEREDETRARLALTEVVLHLVDHGHAALLAPAAPTLAARIRAMVAEAPARAWSSADIEARVGMSGATLRRRLAEERTGLRAVISEARLAAGMQLLYTTALPVKTVAQRVGYASASSFGKRFAERYGLEPSRIGNQAVVRRVPPSLARRVDAEAA